MSANLNQVTLVGNLVFDPESKFTAGGTAVCNLRLAVNRKYKDGNGEWKEETAYVAVECYGKQAEACSEYLKKGAPVLVEGRLRQAEWKKDFILQDGTPHTEKHSTLSVTAERVQFLQGRAKADEPLPF